MHWVWRATVAVVVTVAGVLAIEYTVHAFSSSPARFTVAFSPGGSRILTSGRGTTIWDARTGTRLLGPGSVPRALDIAWRLVLPLVLCLVIYGVVTRLFGRRIPFDGHIRCRKCTYILRGLTEPRCPECGERI